MPYVNIRITREGATPAQKLQLIEGATDLLVRVLNKNPATTFVIIDEVDTDNWGVAARERDHVAQARSRRESRNGLTPVAHGRAAAAPRWNRLRLAGGPAETADPPVHGMIHASSFRKTKSAATRFLFPGASQTPHQGRSC